MGAVLVQQLPMDLLRQGEPLELLLALVAVLHLGQRPRPWELLGRQLLVLEQLALLLLLVELQPLEPLPSLPGAWLAPSGLVELPLPVFLGSQGLLCPVSGHPSVH